MKLIDIDRKTGVRRMPPWLSIILLLALAGCAGAGNDVTATQTPRPTETLLPTMTATPTATPITLPTFEFAGLPEQGGYDIMTRVARWQEADEQAPYGSDEWKEHLKTYPAWYREAVVALTGTSMHVGRGRDFGSFLCNGIDVYKEVFRGPDGGEYVAFTFLSNAHCDVDGYDPKISSPLRLLFRGAETIGADAFSHFIGSEQLRVHGLYETDLAAVTVLAGHNAVTDAIQPVGVERLIPRAQMIGSEGVAARGIGVAWMASNDFSFFDYTLGMIYPAGENSPILIQDAFNGEGEWGRAGLPGLSGTSVMTESPVEGVGGLVFAEPANSALNTTVLLLFPDDIREQMQSARETHYAILSEMGYELVEQ